MRMSAEWMKGLAAAVLEFMLALLRRKEAFMTLNKIFIYTRDS